MNQDDPFANFEDDDKTVLKPSPGRQRKPQASPTPPPESLPPVTPPEGGVQQQLQLQSDTNPLLGSALPILALVMPLRNSASHHDIGGLRNAVINEIKAFDQQARGKGCAAAQVQTARYLLCSLVDEVVLNTPWGGNSIWATQGMLITFHKESWGGEKFFQVLDNVIGQPGIYLDLLEVFYYCLSLGFEGKYRVLQRGSDRLQEVRENLYRVIQRQKGDFDRELSLQWRGITDKRNVLAKYVPLWVIGLATAAFLMLLFLGFLYSINQTSGPLMGQLYQIKDAIKAPAPAPMVVEQKPLEVAVVEPTVLEKIRSFLQPEIEQKKVAVLDQDGQTMIRILAKSFFASGSDNIRDRHLPLLNRIAQALEVVKTPITVVGHTDNVPIFTARFPSNWDLSRARAQAVADVLRKHQLKHVIAEGRADTQSLVPNDTAAHRALNRRVEINF
ncbi:type IVB secretion system protein IcmH/DotU [Methylomarinum sp. Ch1-1]|uniref:Type IVB secretion system protein IcmH/DotU n=1 Tax=Methylomarinum roseum TaxID=3067653 RepID=A0AAU7NSE2_9GAMM